MLHACIAKEYSNGSTTVLLLKMYLYKEGCHWDLTTAEREKGRYSDGDGEGRGERGGGHLNGRTVRQTS
jgi:hypothetical protein